MQKKNFIYICKQRNLKSVYLCLLVLKKEKKNNKILSYCNFQKFKTIPNLNYKIDRNYHFLNLTCLYVRKKSLPKQLLFS